ncbi:MAG: protein kinase [Fischerella sp.]|jgi:WD40 repeat protein/tRNA A-37 threonylcarbamoyl transferase component Bud32|uniref:serine/threonine-protein kinase n=1 Tax=Fischerella sp. TaxID=1191 RepID=UPI0017E071FE|nr:serine/threonine-protein kinase [Fischerella sp.]NWF61537.1 protein kinase [Fischerella sp.]
MICCLNPDCQNPLNPEGSLYCENCKTPLISLLRGHYRVIERLSVEGGFSITYLAEDIDKLNEKCVVKQLAPKVQETGALKKAVQLFEQEAQRLQELGEHPQIPHLLAYFEQDNYLYLVQQFIDGQNLRKELHQRGRFSEKEIRELLLDLLPVLKFIHERGVIHRDIKPQNIIRRQSDGRLVLIDFGASKLLTATVQAKMGTTIGSHGYTPIEQMQDGEAYPASDLFSLGTTCFYLLTGVSPSKLWMKQGYGWVESWWQYFSTPSRGGLSLSMELGMVIEKLLKVNIQERYQSADEVMRDLTRQPSLLPVPETILSNSSETQPGFLLRPGRRFKNRLLLNAAIVIFGLGGVWFFLSRQQGITQSSNSNQPKETIVKNSDQTNTLKGHASDVNSVTFSPDGQKLATGSDDKTIKVWNVATKEEILTLKGHSEWVWSLAFSPDGQTLASAGADKTIKIWNLATNKEIRTLKGHAAGVTSIAFSPDGKTLASGSLDNTVKLWSLETGKEICTFKGHSQSVASVAFSPDGQTVASGSWDKTIKIWSLATEKAIRTLKGHADLVISVAFSPDGNSLASGSKDKTIKLWNLATGEVTLTLKAHTDKVNSVAFVPNTAHSKSLDGVTLVSGSSDNTIKLWNLKTEKEIRTLKKDSGYIYSVAISPDGQTIASGGSAENIVKIWRLLK